MERAMTWNPQLLRLEITALFAPLARYQFWSDDAIRRQEKLRWYAIELYRARHLDWQRRNRPHVQAKGREYEAKRKSSPDFRERRNANARKNSRHKNVIAWQEEDLRCLNCEQPFRRKFQHGRPTHYCCARCKRQYRYRVYGKEWAARQMASRKAGQS